MPLVVFAITARIELERRLARRPAGTANPLERQMDDIRGALQEVFPDAAVAIVQDVYAGFRTRDGERILLVEIANSGDLDGLGVVKLGPPERLLGEWNAWLECRPPGLRHDIVLMNLQRVPADGPVRALVYADAKQLIGVDRTQSLESAVEEAVRLGEPTLESVGDLLFQLYERLGLLLYRHSFDVGPAAEPDFELATIDPHWTANLDAWSRELADLRSTANTQADTRELYRQFRDPVRMLQALESQPTPFEYVPRMRRGRSHGDLHGRNVLVGRVGDRVLWPAVYDFGAMGRLNWIGLDFVKMEVELKIRLYRRLFPAVTAAYILPFESKLNRLTEHGRDTGHWPSRAAAATPEDRLLALLADLRQLAGRHLGRDGRSRLWLAEYYFQLAVYGLNAGRFANLNVQELQAAYLAAGAAAARFLPVPERRPT